MDNYYVHDEEYGNKKCCRTCIHFDDRTHFCRVAPPVPVVFYDSKTRENKVSSKFPVITLPDLDMCSMHEINGNN